MLMSPNGGIDYVNDYVHDGMLDGVNGYAQTWTWLRGARRWSCRTKPGRKARIDDDDEDDDDDERTQDRSPTIEGHAPRAMGR